MFSKIQWLAFLYNMLVHICKFTIMIENIIKYACLFWKKEKADISRAFQYLDDQTTEFIRFYSLKTLIIFTMDDLIRQTYEV